LIIWWIIIIKQLLITIIP